MKQKLSEHTAAFSGLLGLLAFSLFSGMARASGQLSFAALTPLAFVLLIISLLVYTRLRLTRLAEEEKRDQSYLTQESASSTLFDRENGATDPFSTGRTKQQIESYVVPWVAPLLGVLLFGWAWRLNDRLPWELVESSRLTLSASLFGGLAFLFFLSSRFLLGLSRHPDSRLLRGPGILLGLVCWGALAGLVGSMAEHFGWAGADNTVARILLAVLALLGLEQGFNSLLALYSHRRDRLNTTYESKLGALIVDPGILTRSVTEAMDYQFGFSFSQTWFFKIMQRAIIPLIIVQAALLYAMSCFVFLAPHETGILERFGKPVSRDAHLESGFHLKRPWPFESVRRVPTGRVHGLEIGFTPNADGHRPPVMTWTVPHYEQEDIFLVASRSAPTDTAALRDSSGVAVSMVTVNLPIEYRITNAFDYAYRFADPEHLVRQLMYQTATRHFARHDLGELLGPQRRDISQSMRRDLQAAADALNLGITIEYMGIQGVHPPVQVAEAFQSVVGALEEKEAAILEARAYTNQVLPLARAYAESAQSEAAAFAFRRTTLAEAESRHFIERLAAHQISPAVFRAYQYLAMLQQAAAPSRLYVTDLPDQGTQTLWLNLEEKQFSGALDMTPLMMEGSH